MARLKENEKTIILIMIFKNRHGNAIGDGKSEKTISAGSKAWWRGAIFILYSRVVCRNEVLRNAQVGSSAGVLILIIFSSL